MPGPHTNECCMAARHTNRRKSPEITENRRKSELQADLRGSLILPPTVNQVAPAMRTHRRDDGGSYDAPRTRGAGSTRTYELVRNNVLSIRTYILVSHAMKARGGVYMHAVAGRSKELVFDVRWGSVAPWAAVGGARAAQVANSPTAEPLTDLCVLGGSLWPGGAIPVDADYDTRSAASRSWCVMSVGAP
jgi:hypothetical protein